MSDLSFKYIRPIVTGTPGVMVPPPRTQSSSEGSQGVSFQELLQEKSISFSKHAAQRVEDRNISLDSDRLERLQEGMRLAEDKNLTDALILVDQTAFLVNVPSGTVITTKESHAMSGNVFTNINGTVII